MGFTHTALLLLATAAQAHKGALVSDSLWADYGIDVELSRDASRRFNDYRVEFTVSNNHASKEYGIVKWNSPFAETISENLFSVSPSATYKGRIVERHLTHYPASELVTIAPGSSETVTIDLAAYLRFPLVGSYSLSLDFGLSFIDTSVSADTVINRIVTTNAISIAVTSATLSQVDGSNDVKFASLGGASQYIYGCTQYNEDRLVDAVNLALDMAESGLYWLNNGLHTDSFEEWFGENNDASQAEVLTESQAIYDFLVDSDGYKFVCDIDACTDPYVLAFVSPDDSSHTIHICPAFFYSKTGREWSSQAGIILHEVSHFEDVAATRDWGYGKNNARTLAVEHSDRARNNADTYRYFYEDPAKALAPQLDNAGYTLPTLAPTHISLAGTCHVPDPRWI
jgi:peptidyl-Lys metalloendopeptidase